MSSTYTRLIYHVVFATKGRRACLRQPWVEDCHDFIGGIVRQLDGKMESIGGHLDHVHICMRLLPRYALSDVMRTIKAKSSRWVTDEGHLADFRWQTGYGAFTVSHSQIPAVVRYIENQEAHHRQQTYEDEIQVLRRKHGIPDAE